MCKSLKGVGNGKEAGKIFWGSVESDGKERKEEYLARTLFYTGLVPSLCADPPPLSPQEKSAPSSSQC